MKKNNLIADSLLILVGLMLLFASLLFEAPNICMSFGISFVGAGVIYMCISKIRNRNTRDNYRNDYPDERTQMIIEKTAHIMQACNLFISCLASITVFVIWQNGTEISTKAVLACVLLFTFFQLLCPQIIYTYISKKNK